jgi:hypothetical protein
MCFLFFILTLFWIFFSPHFSIFLCDKHNVVISKVHYESIISLTIFMMFPIKVYDNMNN